VGGSGQKKKENSEKGYKIASFAGGKPAYFKVTTWLLLFPTFRKKRFPFGTVTYIFKSSRTHIMQKKVIAIVIFNSSRYS